MAAFNYNTNGENYVTIKDTAVQDENKIGIFKILFHELVGHCLLSKNEIKSSPRLNNYNSGLSFDKIRKDIQYDINFESLQNIEEFLKDETGSVKLNKNSRSLLVNYSRSKNSTDYFKMGEELVDTYLNDIEFKEISLPIGVETKKIGVELNEGVTEFLAIYMSTSDEEEFNDLIQNSPYYDYLMPFFDLDEKIISLHKDNSRGIYDCLYDARLTGQPYKIIRFLRDKTGITITPKELFALDFSKILGE